MGLLDVPPISRAQGDARYARRGQRSPRGSTLLGSYLPADTAFPTVTVGSANGATTLTGTPVTIWGSPTSGINWAGTWSASTAYTTNQWVGYGSPYLLDWVAVAPSTGVTPGTDSTKWQRLVPDNRFTVIGGPGGFWRSIATGGSSFTNGITNAFIFNESNTVRSLIVAFTYTGQSFDVLLPGSGGKVRISVDGNPDPAGWRSIPTGSQIYRFNLAFAQVDTHTVVLELSQSAFYGVTIGASDAFGPAVSPTVPRAVCLGDSITFGQNTDGTRLETFPNYLSKFLNWDVWEFGEGGTGFLNPGSLTGYTKFQDRLPVTASYTTPDVLIACGGLNDQASASASYTPAANQAAMTAYINAARTQFPNALVVVVGPFFTNDLATNAVNYNSIKAVRDAQLAAVQAVPGVTYNAGPNTWTAPNLLYVDTVPGWLSGQYGTGGSANVLLSSDGIHPNQAGHRYYARRIAAAIAGSIGGAGLL